MPGRRDMCIGRTESRGGGPSSPGSLRAPVEVGYGSASLQDPVRGAGNPAFVDSGGSTPVGPVRGLVPTGYVLWFDETSPGNARGQRVQNLAKSSTYLLQILKVSEPALASMKMDPKRDLPVLAVGRVGTDYEHYV